MLKFGADPAPQSFDPALRGLAFAYRENEVNHCPGCGRTHWLIGRQTAECAFCATTLQLAEGAHTRACKPAIWRRGSGGGHVR